MKKSQYIIAAALLVAFIVGATSVFASGAVSVIENHPTAGTTTLFSGRTVINYAAGSCADKCRFNQQITDGAYNDTDQVPLPYYTGVYALMDDGGSFQVCFDTHLLTKAAIYRYDAGSSTWIFVTDQNVNPLCASQTGNGNIGLFGILSERATSTATGTTDPTQTDAPTNTPEPTATEEEPEPEPDQEASPET